MLSHFQAKHAQMLDHDIMDEHCIDSTFQKALSGY